MKLLLIIICCLILAGCGTKANNQPTSFKEYAEEQKQYELDCEERYQKKLEEHEEVCGNDNIQEVSGSCERRIGGCIDYKIIKSMYASLIK